MTSSWRYSARSTGNAEFYRSTAVVASTRLITTQNFETDAETYAQNYLSTVQATCNSASLTHGHISQKNMDEAVDQRWRQVNGYETMKHTLLNIC